MAESSQEAPLEWGTIDFQPILEALAPLQTLIGYLDQLVSLLSSILEVLKTAIGIASLLLTAIDDIFAVVYGLIVDLIESMIQQLTQTGVYNIIHYPPSLSKYITPQEWCQAVGYSLDDAMDSERPILVDPYAYVCAVAMVTTSDNLKDLMESWNSFCAMLGSFVKNFFNQFGNWPSQGDPFEVVPGVGQVPNWKSQKLSDLLPCMNQAADYLKGLIDSLSLTAPKSELLEDFVTFLDEKVTTMAMYGQKILAVLGIINAILNIEGLYTLVIEGQGDASWLKERLLSAIGGPHDYGKFDADGNPVPEDQQKEATFTLGTMFLITGGTSSAVSILSSFFTGDIFPALNPDIPQIPDLP